MSILAGIDGCPSAWFAITQDTETQQTQFEIVSDLAEFYDRHRPSVVSIDIPIGLTDFGARQCDLDARRMLRKRGCCVFPAPIRPAVQAPDRPSAHAISIAIQRKGVPAQAFGIYSKVLEVDNLLQANPELTEVFFEVHPELSFFALNEDKVISHPKKSPPGFAQRLSLIQDVFGNDAFDVPRNLYTKSKVSDDDILDAYAALWSAMRISEGTARRCPAVRALDSRGVPMAMWF